LLVTYNSPNRPIHYQYAAALAAAGCLKAFVSGFSRFSPRSPLPEVGDRLIRADHVQNLFLAGLKFRLPVAVNDELAYWSKLWLDHLSEEPARNSDLFLFYNGAGLGTARRLRGTGVVRVVEVVNSHVLLQEEILREEHARLKLPFRPFHKRETARRVREYEEADAILCPSEFARLSFIERGIPEGKIMKVVYGLTLEPVERRADRDPDLFRVLYVGQISIRKGLRYLVEAFDKLKRPGKELLIVGPRAPVTGLEGMSIPAGVKFAGTLKDAGLAAAYRSASVFVLPSVEDGMGLVMGEALSFGVPVIATVNTGAADLFTTGVEGWRVPIRDPEAIREKLQLLADDPAALAAMSASAAARSRAQGGWDAAGRLLVENLRSLTNRR